MEKSPKNYDVLIIGAGPAGANAAISYKHLNPKLPIPTITALQPSTRPSSSCS